jgi:hypothetical protein
VRGWQRLLPRCRAISSRRILRLRLRTNLGALNDFFGFLLLRNQGSSLFCSLLL